MRRPRHHESFDPVILSREVSREVSRREHFHVPEPAPEPEPAFIPEPSFEPDPTPAVFQELSAAGAPHSAEVISLDAMRTTAPSYEAEDLDVPAFLRKRSEVM